MDKDTIVLADFANSTGDPFLTTRCGKVWQYSSNNHLSSASFPRIGFNKHFAKWAKRQTPG